MGSQARANGERVKRLQRVRAVLENEIAQQPFLPENVKTTLTETIGYLNATTTALVPEESVTA